MEIKYSQIRKCFSDWVKDAMNARAMTQADLVKSSLLSKTTISRIYRNSNDKGSTYEPTLSVVKAISIGLKLNRTEAREMLYSAFPDMELWGDFLDKQLDIYKVNDILYDNGLELWGSPQE